MEDLSFADKWDFSPGVDFASRVWSRFRSPVNSPRSPSSAFRLVVCFSHFSFRLSVDSVAIALNCCLGGNPNEFRIRHLQNSCYSFWVTDRKVGLWIYSLKPFQNNFFKLHFHLWRNGGPDWYREYTQWVLEEDNSWTKVVRKSKPISNGVIRPGISFAHVVSQPSRSRAAVPIKKVFDTIKDSISDPKHPAILPVRKSVFDILDFSRHKIDHDSGRNLHPDSSPKAGSSGSLKCSNWATGHSRPNFRSRVRCNACFVYGHKARFCLAQSKTKACTKWVVKESTRNIGTKQVTSIVSSPAPSLPQAKQPLLIQSTKPSSPDGRIDQSSASMADVQCAVQPGSLHSSRSAYSGRQSFLLA